MSEDELIKDCGITPEKKSYFVVYSYGGVTASREFDNIGDAFRWMFAHPEHKDKKFRFSVIEREVKHYVRYTT